MIKILYHYKGAFWPFRVECIQWEWEAGRHWTTYEMVSACILESQWHRYCTYGPSMAKNRDSIETSQTQYFELPIPSLTENYEVDFSTMEQKNSKTGTKRRINRYYCLKLCPPFSPLYLYSLLHY